MCIYTLKNFCTFRQIGVTLKGFWSKTFHIYLRKNLLHSWFVCFRTFWTLILVLKFLGYCTQIAWKRQKRFQIFDIFGVDLRHFPMKKTIHSNEFLILNILTTPIPNTSRIWQKLQNTFENFKILDFFSFSVSMLGVSIKLYANQIAFIS